MPIEPLAGPGEHPGPVAFTRCSRRRPT